MKKINKKGFTLVELLLVIAIIGILAAVLFVSLGSQRERARITAFKEQMRSLVPAITTCLDSDGTLQASGDGTAICAPAGTHGSYLSNADRNDCDDPAAVYGVAVGTDSNGNPALVGTCTTTDAATDCVATCGVQGCAYVNCE